jgi:hypothetical protein
MMLRDNEITHDLHDFDEERRGGQQGFFERLLVGHVHARYRLHTPYRTTLVLLLLLLLLSPRILHTHTPLLQGRETA